MTGDTLPKRTFGLFAKVWRKVFIEKRMPRRHLQRLIAFIKNTFGLKWKTNLHRIELEITTGCSLSCYNCDRSSAQAPSSESMTVDQIRWFVEESIKTKWRWREIHILGGEPTLHPQLSQILEELKRYKDFYPRCRLILISNGYAKRTKEVLSNLPTYVEVLNTSKTGKVNEFFSAYNMAPVDAGVSRAQASRACDITQFCGVGFSRYGFYLCGAGASIDRVFGFDIGIKSLRQLTGGSLDSQRAALCSLCGHLGKQVASEQKSSPTWEKAYARYKIKKPNLRLYEHGNSV